MNLQISKIDPLLCDFEMPLESVYYPLGFPLEIATNSPQVLAAADESWGHFRNTFATPPMKLRIGVTQGPSAVCPPAPVCREQRNMLVRVADAGNFSASDLLQGFAFAWLTSAAVEHKGYLRWHFIEGMSWDLLGSRYITAVHAACVKRGEYGVLLCGDDGAGKSMLSYACARNGWTFLSDDSCCLIRGRNDRLVIGNPYQIRFRESAIEILPELKHHRRTPHNGEMAIEIPTAEMPEVRTTLSCCIESILFLNRVATGPARIVPFPKDTALRWFEQLICTGTPEIREAHRATLRNLLAGQILELQYSDLPSAVAMLNTLALKNTAPETASTIVLQGPENA